MQLKGYGISVLAGVDPNEDNFVSAGIINTRTTLIGCLLRLEPNKETKVSPPVIINVRRERCDEVLTDH